VVRRPLHFEWRHLLKGLIARVPSLRHKVHPGAETVVPKGSPVPPTVLLLEPAFATSSGGVWWRQLQPKIHVGLLDHQPLQNGCSEVQPFRKPPTVSVSSWPGIRDGGCRLNGDAPRPADSGRRDHGLEDPPSTHSGRWRLRNSGGKADIANRILANSRFAGSAAAVQRLLAWPPAAS